MNLKLVNFDYKNYKRFLFLNSRISNGAISSLARKIHFLIGVFLIKNILIGFYKYQLF